MAPPVIVKKKDPKPAICILIFEGMIFIIVRRSNGPAIETPSFLSMQGLSNPHHEEEGGPRHKYPDTFF